MRWLGAALAAWAMIATSGPVAAAERAAHGRAVISVCHGYGCRYRTPVRFSAKDMAHLKALVAAGRKSPAAERAALGRAVKWFEITVGPIAGTSTDKPKGDVLLFPDPTQEDCIDESTNTTSFLKLIESHGWLRYHTVGRTKERGFILDGRYPHNTAVVIEKDTGEKWAIDSWIPANGHIPDIKPLDVWKKEGVWGETS